ncbi:hypothetical protein P9112_012675 [Eukaryota sp. TZLM1-RC]
MEVHSDNGPEFSKAVFDALSEFLGIEVSKSVPHFSQSNGLVECRHRDILQNLRKLLVDFNAYDAWSEYIPYVQLLINSSKSSITGYSPYELMFGSDFSPRADPGKIIETLESSTSESTYINDIQSKFARLKKKQEEAELRQASKAPPRDSQIEANPFSPGQLVKRASSSTAKLHGNYKGPFLVIDTPSTSTADIKNLCTGIVVKAILSQDGDYCQVQWPGNHITTELVSTVQNTSAYKEFSKSVSNTRSRPSRRKRRSDNINNSVNPTPIRPRRSKRRKGSIINITYRSVVHDVDRVQLYAMCKSDHIEAAVEPLVRKLSPKNEDENTFGKRRADLITPGSDDVIKVVDVVTVDVCKDSAIDFANKDATSLCFAEKCKIIKYNEPLS